jgi:hypothetical protein
LTRKIWTLPAMKRQNAKNKLEPEEKIWILMNLTKPLSNLESEMIQNIVRTISGENKPTITQRLHRSIRKCIQTYIADASLLLCFSKWDSAITDTTPQRENAGQ